MVSIERSPVPPNSLLHAYTTNGAYADAYSTESVRQITLPEYMYAFYTTPLFKLERMILKIAIARGSTDSQARELATGRIDSFAAWRVEARREDEILLCDVSGRTRSWLKVLPLDDGSRCNTGLYFGSAVVPVRDPNTGEMSLGPIFRSLMPFHRIYSVLLLYSAKLRIEHSGRLSIQEKEFLHE